MLQNKKYIYLQLIYFYALYNLPHYNFLKGMCDSWILCFSFQLQVTLTYRKLSGMGQIGFGLADKGIFAVKLVMDIGGHLTTMK